MRTVFRTYISFALMIPWVALAQNAAVPIDRCIFSGVGLNDATCGGQWTGGAKNAQFAVKISATGSPDHFTWTKNGGSASSPVAITSAAQQLSDGVTIQFAATTGHTLADTWVTAATASGSSAASTTIQRGVGAVSRFQQDVNRERVSSVKDYGAKGDGVALSGCSQSAASTTLHCPSAGFTSADIGKYISVAAAGAGGIRAAWPFGTSGLDDATSGGVFGGVTATYAITISATGTPDHFTWTKNGGSASAPVAVTGSAQALADGVTVTFGATTGHALGSGWYIQAYTSALGGTISSITDSAHAVLSVAASWSTSGASVTYGTNDFAAIRAAGQAICNPGNIGGKLLFTPGIYVIGQHKTYSGSATDTTGDIFWTGCQGVTLEGYGAAIYVDAAFHQLADSGGGKSNENTITPFYVTQSRNTTVAGFTILGNKDQIFRDPGVTTEGLTSFGVASSNGTIPGNVNITIRDVTVIQPQTDCFITGNDAVAVDANILLENDTCIEPSRGNFTLGNIQGAHLRGVHGSLAGAGMYGGYQPKFCVDVEAGSVGGYTYAADNILFDGGSTCTDDIGWEFTVSDPTKIGSVTVKDSVFSWSNCPAKQAGFNASSAISLIENNIFNVNCSASVANVQAIVGDASYGFVSQRWVGNQFSDSTGTISGASILDSGFLTGGTLQPLDFENNTFHLRGLYINMRNSRLVAGNHISATATGSEASGSNVAAVLSGSQSVHDNDWNTDLAASGKHMTTFYDSLIPVVNTERYLSPTYFQPGGGVTSGTSLVALTVPTSCAGLADGTPYNNGGVMEFCPINTANYLLNSDFATNSDWIYAGGWAYGAGAAVGTNVSGGDVMYQTVHGVVAGQVFILEYTVGSYSGGGSVRGFMQGSTFGSFVSVNGLAYDTYTSALAGDVNVGVSGSSNFNGTITGIKLIPVPPSGLIAGTGISISGGPYAPVITNTATAGSGFSGFKTRTACSTITGGVPTGCSNVTETYLNGLLQ